MRAGREGNGPDAAVDDSRQPMQEKKPPSLLSYRLLGKRTKEGCDRCSEDNIVHNGEGPAPL